MTSPDLSIAILGGDTCPRFCEQLRDAGLAGAVTTQKVDVTTRSGLIAPADVVIIVVNTLEGPVPQTREAILLARQFAECPVLVAFSRSNELDDARLLALEVEELKNTLRTYGLPSDDDRIVFDSPRARTRLPKGIDDIVNRLRDINPSNASIERAASSGPYEAIVYVLADPEAFRRGLTRPVGSGKYQVLIEGKLRDAEFLIDSPIEPAGNGYARVSVDGSEQERLGLARFVIVEADHILAVGTLFPAGTVPELNN